MDDIILYAIPVFVILVVAEWFYGWRKNKNTYRLNDTLSSLSQGLMGQAVAVCTQLFQVGLYTLCFHRINLFPASTPFWNSAWGWLLAIVVFDLCDYWLHRAGHEIGVLWAAHVVHHQSEAFNFSTALRQESFVPLFGWVFYIPMAVMGVPPTQFLLAGLIVLFYQFWIHTEHIGRLGWFDRVFSSPSNHRVHHAVNPQYINKNYGGMLVVWDRLFGTFQEEDEKCVYGTQTPLNSSNPLWALFAVYAGLAHDAYHARRWRDKLRLWFMPTGWRPADVAVRFPSAPFDISVRQLYNPPMHVSQAVLAVTEFTLMTAATGWLLARTDEIDWLHNAAAASAIGAGLALIGVVMSRRLRVVPALAWNLPIAALLIWGLIQA
jgi:alkylglycerol monooxygenase